MPVEVGAQDLIRLGVVTSDDISHALKKTVQRLIREKIIVSYRKGTDLFMLSQKANRDCLFLDSQTRLCTVYEKRPEVCRQFPSIGPRPGYCPVGKKKNGP